MANENIAQFPTPLERLAAKLADYLKRDTKNHADWIDVQEGICLTLVEARDQFRADIEFGQWFDANGFTIDPHTRAAAIEMGRNPEALRACLEITDRRSLRMIYKKEFSRFGTTAKPKSRRKQSHLPFSRPSDQFKLALEAYDELAAKGETITARAIMKMTGLSETPVRRAMERKRAEAELDPLTPTEMRASMLKRYELAIKKARFEIREELKAEVYQELDVFARRIKERSDRADRILGGYKGVMSRETFRKIKACLHPDHNTFKFPAEALQAFSELEVVLVKPDNPTYEGPPLPTTAAELMARRRRR